MSKDAKFLRLLSDYELLTRDETFALTESDVNFQLVAQIQEKKAIILAELIKEGEHLGIKRWKYPAIQERFARLIELEQANADYVASQLSKIKQAIEEIQMVAARVQGLNRIYLGSIFEDPKPRINTLV